MKIPSIILVAALLLTGTAAVASAQSDIPRDELYVTDGPVNAIVQSGGILYIGGSFTSVGPHANGRVQLDASSGAPVAGFPKVNGTVSADSPDGSGGRYIGGTFTKVGGLTRNRLAHIDAANNVSAWDPNANGTVSALAVDGSTVYACGSFTIVGGQTRNGIAALDATSGVPTAWNPNANTDGFASTVAALAVDGSIVYAGGYFTGIGGEVRNQIAALDATTGLATAWDPNASHFSDPSVTALAVDGSIVYAGGHFTRIGGEVRNYIAALDATTGLATAWDPNASPISTFTGVNALAVDGSIVYAGGSFTGIGGEVRNQIAALDATTGAATAWNPNLSIPLGGVNNSVSGLAVDEDIVYAGLGFIDSDLRPQGLIVALDKTNGVPTWEVKANHFVGNVALDGNTVYVSGLFSSIGAPPRNNIAALDATSGALMPWNPNADGVVRALAVSGSTVYAGGAFTNIGGESRSNIAALDATSGLATAWNPNADFPVHALAVSGSTVYAGGAFGNIGGQLRRGIAAIDATTGALTTWDPDVSGVVNALAVSGSTVYAGGDFLDIGLQPRSRIAAIDSTTGAPTAWNPSANNVVNALAVGGSKVYAGGAFTNIGGQTRIKIAALDATTGLATAWNPSWSSTSGRNVNALAVDGNTVYAGGRDVSARIKAVDATTGLAAPWNPRFPRLTFVGALPPSINALAVDGSTVYAGGNFHFVGDFVGAEELRAGLAGFYKSGCAPAVITFCPLDMSVQCGNSTAPSNTGTATATGTGVSVSFSDVFVAGCGSTGVITRTWTATGTCGTASCEQEVTIVDTTAPVVTITGPASGAVYAVGSAVSFTGSFTDNCGSPHTATWMFDAITQPGVVTEGAPGAVTAGYTFTAAGVYKVKLTVTDACVNAGTAEQIDGVAAMVVIYDPSAGFVTGSGSITSPPGAYPASPMLTGKASFGFVSKYKKGATVPTGETEFLFKAASLSFNSTTYEWLVVSGSRAQYKGTGTFNGVSGHGFLLTAVDGAIAGGGGIDKFRIKITNASGVVYDNQISDPDDATPNTALLGGAIIINTGGKGNSPAAGGPQAEDGGEENLSASIPTEYGLSQNHPNPFDRSTRIDFSLPERSRVTLVVFDLVGREVRTLADGEWEPGRHSAMLTKVSSNGSTLGAGVYFVRINAQSLASGRSFSSLRKVVVLR